jgi:hypothetical protein
MALTCFFLGTLFGVLLVAGLHLSILAWKIYETRTQK